MTTGMVGVVNGLRSDDGPASTPSVAEGGALLRLGCVPPEATRLGSPLEKLPSVQLKPRTRLSFWVISAKVALSLTFGAGLVSVLLTSSILARSSGSPRTVRAPVRSL